MSALTVRLPDDLHKRLRWRAVSDGVSVNRLVAYALLAYLEAKDEEDQHA